MSADGAVTHWLGRLKAGEQAAAEPLWQCYFQRLVRLARQKLHGARPCGADEEDVALSAFHSFCRGVQQGHFPQLADHHDLWRLLVVITAREVFDLRKREHAVKGGGEVADECRRLLDRLGDAGLRELALLKMEGYTNEEIAGRLGCALATVERRLRLIRGTWEKEGTR